MRTVMTLQLTARDERLGTAIALKFPHVVVSIQVIQQPRLQQELLATEMTRMIIHARMRQSMFL